MSCFRLVPREQFAVAGCVVWASFCAHAAIFGFVSKVVVFTSCVVFTSLSHNNYCELPGESFLMFLKIDTRNAHSSPGLMLT